MDKIIKQVEEALKKEKILFASYAVTNKNNTVLYEHYGTQDLSRELPPTNKTRYRIASMSKAVTTLGALKLFDRGELKLDALAKEYFPELGEVKVAKLENDKVTYEDLNSDITIHQLLTHTSGFGYDFHDPVLSHLVLNEEISSLTSKDGSQLNAPLVYQPGTRWEYGISLGWIGKIIEKISSKNLNDFITDEVFLPLGMNDSTFDAAKFGNKDIAVLHAMDNDTFVNVDELIDDSTANFFYGGGGIYSTPDDYCKFMRLFLNNGEANGNQFISSETLELMKTNQIGDLNYEFQPTYNPSLIHAHEWYPNIKKKFTYGFLTNLEDLPGGRKAGSLAWSGICNTYFWIDPYSGIAGTAMMQLSPHYDKRCISILEALEKASYSELDVLNNWSAT
jgi:CubicO group peptidase (beta-lactamase class C family)